MAGRSDYIDFIMEKLAPLGEGVVSARKMFGGHVIHMAGKVLGFVFDDTFLFEPGPEADRLLPEAPRAELFPGSKLFVVIDESMGSPRLCELALACYDDFPLPKPRKKKSQKEKAPAGNFPFAKQFKE